MPQPLGEVWPGDSPRLISRVSFLSRAPVAPLCYWTGTVHSVAGGTTTQRVERALPSYLEDGSMTGVGGFVNLLLRHMVYMWRPASNPEQKHDERHLRSLQAGLRQALPERCTRRFSTLIDGSESHERSIHVTLTSCETHLPWSIRSGEDTTKDVGWPTH